MSGNEKAQVSLANILNTGVRKHGKSILNNLCVAVRLTRLYQSSHQNVREALEEFVELLQGFMRLQGTVNLSLMHEFLFLNDVRIQVDFGGYDTYKFVVDLFKDRDIGDVSFSQGITPSELEQLVNLLNVKLPGRKPAWEEFSALLAKQNLPNIDFSQLEVRHDVFEDISDDVRKIAIRTFFKAISSAGKAISAAQEGRRINLKSLKIAIQAIVDLTLDDEHLLLALTNVRDFGRLGANHAVNVAVLGVAIGAKLGLSKRILGDLGITGLLHDIGKADAPEELQKTCIADLEGDRFEQYYAHVYEGTETLLRQSLVHQIVKSMNVAFLHHYRYDRTGYPSLMATKEQNLFTRVIAVANHYDNSLTPGRFTAAPGTPETVLRELLDKSGTEFDPLVVKAFVNLMGLYPVGSMVRLDTGEIATVIAPPTNPRFLDRPTVRLVSDKHGKQANATLNLLDRFKTGKFKHSILKFYQHEEVNLELEEYLAVI